MKRYTILLTLLFALINTACVDKKEDSFTIIGKWQFIEMQNDNGEWIIIENGSISEFCDCGTYREGDYLESTYTFDESTMILKIKDYLEFSVEPESNKIMVLLTYQGSTRTLKKTKYKRIE